MASAPSSKSDYSRLQDDDFLNHTEHDRVRAATRAASRALSASSDELYFIVLRYTVAFMAGAAVTAIMFMVVLLVATGHRHSGLLDATDKWSATSHEAAPVLGPPVQTGNRDAHLRPWRPALQAQPALVGSRVPVEDDHDHSDGHDHIVHPDDVLMEDHHILQQGEPEPTEHVLLVCHRKLRQLPASSTNSSHATATPSDAVQLTRNQRDAVLSAVEFLSDKMQCAIVVLHGVDADEVTPSTTANRTAPGQFFNIFGHSGCGSTPSDNKVVADDVDDVGSEPAGSLSLLRGRTLPVVRWDARLLFARSPLAASWAGLRHRAAQGAWRGPGAAPAATSLLDLAARLLLLWRHGGVSVNVHSSADQVLKALSAFNTSDTSHSYLETTRAALIAAPGACNAVVYDLIAAIAKEAKRTSAVARTTGARKEQQSSDPVNVNVFDGILNELCRGSDGPRRASTEPRTSVPSSSTPSSNLFRPRRHMFGPRLHSTRVSSPDVREDGSVHVDTTLCKSNLVAISLP